MQQFRFSGRIAELGTYWSAEKKIRATKTKGNTSIRKTLANLRQAARRLASVLNCNFTTSDIFATAGFDDEHLPGTKKEAAKVVRLWLERVGRWYFGQTGNTLRYVYAICDRDPKTKKKVRLHAHIVMDDVAIAILREKWGNGDVHSEYLYHDANGEFLELATYIIENSFNEKNEKKYVPSRNLKKPVVPKPERVRRKGEFKLPKGARLIERQTTHNRYGTMEYVRYVLPKDYVIPEREIKKDVKKC